MGRGSLGEVWDGLGDPLGEPGHAGDPQVGLRLVGGPFWRSGTSRVILGQVRNESVDPPGGTGQVWIPCSKFGWVGGHGVVRDRLVDPRGDPGRFLGPSGRSGTGRGTLGEVRDGSGEPP